jgi:hypothetical protein
MFDKLKSLVSWGRPSIEAATVLPSQPPPKVKTAQQTLPSYVTSAKPNPASAYLNKDRRLANTDITTLRTGQTTFKVISDFVRASPDLSAAVTACVRTGVTSGYTAVAKNPDGTVNAEATGALAQIITRLNVLNDYSIGFDDSQSIRALSETWALEILKTGAMCAELVLDKSRLPSKIQAISESQIKLYPSKDGKRMVPKQYLAGATIDLDIPTFFRVTLDQDVTEAYAASPLESAIQAVLFSAEFMNDIRRVVKKAVHPRVILTIDEEKFRKSIPQDIAYEQDKIVEYRNQVVANVQDMLSGLSPEDAIVVFDSMGIEVMDHGNTNLGKEYEVLQSLGDAKLASGAKVLPTILGHSNGTASVASAEVLLFLKHVEGTIWAKLNEMFSKVFTLAVRLLGHDVYVEFKYDAIELKPEGELEAFRAMKQSRILDLLSLGFKSDEEASIELTGHLPPATFKPLSGTGFRATANNVPVGDGYNGASNGGSALNQSLKSTTPEQPKGPAKKAELDLIQGGAQ